ncbi:unnamed protein product [Onchocerca flexuosa]|uniref:TIR domain-containing protein n=1 Tax=Onchocerca flexuosa TaxID=387005 RepID=A0A183GXZ6_9BILA|nr:unnamed protein product [Onchocerca flexuosa]
MNSTIRYEWGIIVFGESNKQRITHEMMRYVICIDYQRLWYKAVLLEYSFADVFRQNSSKLGLNLVHSPSFLFTKNVAMAQREVEEWYEELESGKDEILVVFFNDSDSNEVEQEMQGALKDRILLYVQSGDNLLRCARDETDEIMRCWIKEIRELLSERLYGASSTEKLGSEDAGGADSIKTNNSEAIEQKKLSSGEFPIVFLYFIVIDIFISCGENQEKHEININCSLLGLVHVENILADLQKLEKPLKDLDLIKNIDTSMLHNRLLIPFTDREQNGRLLALLSAASFTKLPDLQTAVVNFVENILKSGLIFNFLRVYSPETDLKINIFSYLLYFSFISFMLRENAYYIRNVASGECHRTLFTHLQDIMQILYIAKVNHIQDFDIACDEFLNFMELIPEKCWSATDEELQLTIFRMLQKLTVYFATTNASEFLTVDLLEDHELNIISNNMKADLHKDHELNIIYNNVKCFDNRVSFDLVKECGFKDYKPAWFNVDVEPPEDFRTLSVYATSNDILHPARPYIRKNITKGSYLSQEHYLDVQFRLMREDLVAPLRDGIRLWKQQKGKETFLSYAMDPSEELDLLVIRGVIVEGAQLKRSTGEIIRYVTFQPISTDNSWSLRLKYGQLVALSSDGFQNEALFATVAEKDSDDFSKGKLGLCFFDDHSISRAKVYTLVESNSYYEMYQHVLECIKRFDNEHQIPFGRFLLKTERDVRFPPYLVKQIDEDSSSSSDSLNSEYTDYSGSRSLTKRTLIAKEISIFGTKYVVDKLKYTLDGDKVGCLDDAQRNALCHALTHEFALIQGPPGTGKTFLGRLIVRILLENINMWNPARTNPILIVCFTNHALDQFLDGVLVDLINDGRYNDELPSIVRIGSRCKSETLQRYTKRPVLEAYTNLISDIARHKANQLMLERIHLLEMIRSEVAVLTLRKNEILSFEYIQRAMLPEHIRQFKLQRQNNGKKCSADEIFCRWLLEGDPGREDRVSEETDMNEHIIDYEREKFFENKDSPQKSILWSMDETFVKTERNEQKEEMLGPDPKIDEWITWKEIQERLLKTNPDVDNYYHSGQWDIDKDPNASAIKPVTIFSDQMCGKSKQHINAKCNAELITSLNDVKTNILKSPPLTLEEASLIKNLQTLHRHRRWALYMHWIDKLKTVVSKKLDTLLCRYQILMKDVKKEFDLLDEIILRKALIIGATTTGAAKIKPFLDRLSCPIIIVEEAAEILEAHVLTSITNECQHAILIGDHQQLRPNPAVFALAREYNLDISLFERLIRNDFPYVTLRKQHRMSIAISKTIMPEFYPLIEDADNVLKYPDVRGCQKNLYFINHLQKEDVFLSTSHKNSFEGDFMVSLSAYFIQQGYACSQITLLCTYTAQANYVRTQVMLKFSDESSFPLVETVDNYQGKENDIIILSLVRSQPSDNIGFLKVSNRVCVALSRSKLGLYVIGNMHFLRSNSLFWNRLYIALADANCIGDGFPAFCIKHNVTQVIGIGNTQLIRFKKFIFLKIIHSADEFLTKTPEGGCYYPCDFIRPCGHICSQPCHRTDQEHNRACIHSCPKTCSTIFRHPCTKLCGESCGACQFYENKIFPCGHTTGVVCHLFEKAVCQQKCPKKLPCGHQCVKKCNEPCKCSHKILLICGHPVTTACSEKQKTKCVVKIEKTFTTCSHRWTVPCHDYENAQCGAKCERILPCGHRCQSLCGNCTLG